MVMQEVSTQHPLLTVPAKSTVKTPDPCSDSEITVVLCVYVCMACVIQTVHGALVATMSFMCGSP